VLLDFGIV
jgi:hypothetical protein